MNDQKNYPEYFRYKIIRVFRSREDAILFEIKIHAKLDVGRNPAFYNKARQTNTGFSTPGMVSVGGKMMTKAEYRTSGLKHHNKGLFIATDKTGIKFLAHSDDDRIASGEIWSSSKNMVRAIRNSDGKKITVSREEYLSGKYSCNNTGKVPAIDKDGCVSLIDKSLYNKGGYRHVTHGFISVIDLRTGKYLHIRKEEFDPVIYCGVNKNKVSGADNPNSKNIDIFDNGGKLRYKCSGDFKKICKEHNLPFTALRRSYSNGGSPIFSSKKTASDAKRMGKTKYIGWYAVVV